jgi:hypothetical protein
MMVFDAMLRSALNGAAIYSPLLIQASEENEKRIREAFAPYVPEAVTSTYNTWRVVEYATGYFIIKRATWFEALQIDSIDELIAWIIEEHTERHNYS